MVPTTISNLVSELSRYHQQSQIWYQNRPSTINIIYNIWKHYIDDMSPTTTTSAVYYTLEQGEEKMYPVAGDVFCMTSPVAGDVFCMTSQ